MLQSYCRATYPPYRKRALKTVQHVTGGQTLLCILSALSIHPIYFTMFLSVLFRTRSRSAVQSSDFADHNYTLFRDVSSEVTIRHYFVKQKLLKCENNKE